jgi:hypothetical protein
MMSNKIEYLVNQLIAKGDVLTPCTPGEVAKIEHHFSCSLPMVYKAFLLAAGKESKLYMTGSHFFYGDIFLLKEYAEELLVENNFKALPEKAFVFFMHQGYQFAFFILDSGDDPEVFYYYEGKTQTDFEKVESSLSGFLITHLGFIR